MKEPLKDSLILKVNIAKRSEAEGEFYDARCSLIAFNHAALQPNNARMGRDIDNAIAFLLEDIAKSLKEKHITFAQLSIAGNFPPDRPPPSQLDQVVPESPKVEESPVPKEKDAMDLAFEEAKALANRSINRD